MQLNETSTRSKGCVKYDYEVNDGLYAEMGGRVWVVGEVLNQGSLDPETYGNLIRPGLGVSKPFDCVLRFAG